MKAEAFFKTHGLRAAKYKADELKITESLGDEVGPEGKNLIRLVESHELVEYSGGIEASKRLLLAFHYKPLAQAIADVESCQ